ncbi:hypothetical protein [Nostoc sp.]|uniref:hypothetical protein n=1 Tax=Nostoc sp. TaxID=1180 RepID=UPI002FFCFD35
MNSQNKPQAFEVNNAEGRANWGMGILWIMLATAEDTNGAYPSSVTFRNKQVVNKLNYPEA